MEKTGHLTAMIVLSIAAECFLTWNLTYSERIRPRYSASHGNSASIRGIFWWTSPWLSVFLYLFPWVLLWYCECAIDVLYINIYIYIRTYIRYVLIYIVQNRLAQKPTQIQKAFWWSSSLQTFSVAQAGMKPPAWILEDADGCLAYFTLSTTCTWQIAQFVFAVLDASGAGWCTKREGLLPARVIVALKMHKTLVFIPLLCDDFHLKFLTHTESCSLNVFASMPACPLIHCC